MSERSTAEKLKSHRRWVRNQRSEPRAQPPNAGVRWGLRNFAAAELTGLSKSNLSNLAKANKFSTLDDGSYDTEEFERFIQARGDPDFRVPTGMRGTQFEEQSSVVSRQSSAEDQRPKTEGRPDPEPEEEPEDIVTGIVVHPGYVNGTNGHGDASEGDLYAELMMLKVQSERLKVERETIRLKADKGEYVPRTVIARTVADAIVQFREALRRVGAEVAPSLVALDDEYEIKRRVDDAMRAVLRRLQDQIHEVMGSGPSA